MKRSVELASANEANKFCMANDTLAITILPAAGGKISAITDLRTCRNRLWQNPHIPISDHRRGDNYDRQLDFGGWDEILFSICPCQWSLSVELGA